MAMKVFILKIAFSAEAEQQLIDDAVRDISIAGIPQVHGIKGIFRRNNRHVKVMIMDNYPTNSKDIN